MLYVTRVNTRDRPLKQSTSNVSSRHGSAKLAFVFREIFNTSLPSVGIANMIHASFCYDNW